MSGIPASTSAMGESWALVDAAGRGDHASHLLAPSTGSAAGPSAATSLVNPAALSTKGPDIRAARTVELRHELVALVSGRLCVNYENLETFRQQADVDKPTLVVSLLGDTSVGKSTLVRELIGDGGEDRPFVQRPAEQLGSSTTSNVNIYTSQRILDGYDVHFLDFEGESGSAEPVMGVASFGSGGLGGSGGPRSARTADSARAATTSALLAAVDSGAGGGGAKSASSPLAQGAATPGTHGISPRGGAGSGSGSSWHPSPGEASVTERMLHPHSGPSDYVSLAAAVLPSSAVSSASASPFSGAGAAPTPGSLGSAAGAASPTAAAGGAGAGPGSAGGGAGPSILARAQHVRETFPRLAYCVSDLIILVGASVRAVAQEALPPLQFTAAQPRERRRCPHLESHVKLTVCQLL